MASEVKIILSAVDNASGVLNKATGSLGKVGKSIGNTAKQFAGLALAGVGAAAAITAITGTIKRAITEATEAEAIQTKLNTVLESTQKAAGLSANEINDMATEMSRLTGIEDESITAMQAVLLTFTRIKKDVFPEATMAVLDMSTALGTDLQSAAIQVGKALQDPILGMTALRRVGVNFDAAAKEIVKTMVEMGDVAGAQKFILAELNTEFGGQAAARMDTYAGKVAALDNSWGNLLETLGTKGLPVLSNTVTLMNDLISLEGDTWFQDGANASANFINSMMGVEIQTKKVWEVFKESKDEINGTAIAMGDFTLSGNKVFAASGDISQGIGSIADEFVRMKDAANGVNESLAGMKFDMLMGGIEGFGESLVQQTAMLLIYKRTMGEITEATFQSSMAKLDELRALERLNKGVLDHTITQGEWLKIMKDNVVTIGEVNEAVGYTTGNMTELQKATGITEAQWASYEKTSLNALKSSNAEAVTAAGLIQNIISNWAGVPSVVTTTYDIYINTHGGGVFEDEPFGKKKGRPFLQYGGPVSANRPYIVGEAGPEMFVPNSPGRIVPNNQLGGMGGGGGGGIVIHNHSAGAAALSWAMVKSHQKRRLQRGMGG